jgi:TonB family protein
MIMRLSFPKLLFPVLLLCAFFRPSQVLTFAKRPDTPAKRVTISGKDMEQRLTHKVEPVYPPEARSANIEGTVKLTALIATDGSVKQLTVNQGHPLLAKAALDAVKQWKYDPVIVNSSPVEVVTSIYVVFQLKK